MVEKVLKLFGWQNRIDLSPAGLDDLKVIGFLISIFIGIFVGIIVPWIYGVIQIGLLIIK